MSKVRSHCHYHPLSIRTAKKEGFADQEWLDAINAERKKEQLNAITYETFEIVIDRLEKEWFDLVIHTPFAFSHPLINGCLGIRPKTYQNLIWRSPLKTQPVRYAMIRKERTVMRSFSVMAVISPFIKVFLSAQLLYSGLTWGLDVDCYGVPYIPEGQWLCRKCTVSPEIPVVSPPHPAQNHLIPLTRYNIGMCIMSE